jgi:hypothetical protein
MRFSALLGAGLMAGLFAADAEAQGAFEGIITFSGRTAGAANPGAVYVKGGRVRMERPGSRGEWLIIDEAGREIAVSESRRQYVVFGTKAHESDAAATFEPMGKNEVIAGYPCTYYRVHDVKGPLDNDEVCITTALGFMAFMPGGTRGTLNPRGVQAQFPKGFFILKSVNSGGTAEVSKIERQSLSDALFAPPAGYTEVKMPVRGGRSGL